MGVQPNNSIDQVSSKTGFNRIVGFISKIVDPLTSKIGVTIGAIVLFSMMLLTFFDVGGRFLLNKPINGSLEITEYMMGLTVIFAIGYTAFRKGHIRVDIIMQFVSRKINLWMDIVANLLTMLFYIFIAWQTWLNAVSTFESKLTSAVLLIPSYPFVFIVAIGAAVVALIFFRDFLNSISEVGR